MPYQVVVPVVDLTVRGLCPKPYPLHPKGCPNFNKKAGCPPQCLTIEKVLDLSRPVWAVWNVFDFAGHVARMREKQPTWSERQLACCLYWQPKARGCLRAEIRKFIDEHCGLTIEACPEACGVNMTATMASIGVALEWPPKTVALQIVLAGSRKQSAPDAAERKP